MPLGVVPRGIFIWPIWPMLPDPSPFPLSDLEGPVTSRLSTSAVIIALTTNVEAFHTVRVEGLCADSL